MRVCSDVVVGGWRRRGWVWFGKWVVEGWMGEGGRTVLFADIAKKIDFCWLWKDEDFEGVCTDCAFDTVGEGATLAMDIDTHL